MFNFFFIYCLGSIKLVVFKKKSKLAILIEEFPSN